MSRFSNKAYLQEMAAQLQPELAFPIGRPEEWPRWRQALRAKVAKLLGGISPPRAEPEARVLERRREDGYVREKIAMRSREGVELPAYLLTPVDERGDGGKRRAVLCLHGHGHGKDDVVGDPGEGTEDERAGRAAWITEHNYDYGRRFAQMGFVVLAPEARGFGERAAGSEQGCYIPGVISLVLGLPIPGQRLHDDMVALDYLCSLPNVDAARVGCAGLSEGGRRTLYLAAMDDRVKAAVISGYYSTLKGAIREWDKLSGWDICNYVPGLLRYADYTDLAALIAPRPLLIESGTEDPLYDQQAVQEALDVTAGAYAALGAPEHFDVDLFAGGHMWSGRKSFAWIDRWLPASPATDRRGDADGG
jgi:dienelactone hydrolase